MNFTTEKRDITTEMIQVVNISFTFTYFRSSFRNWSDNSVGSLIQLTL